jgi:putative lipase involved disintegration of autophagic bodies
MNISKILLLLCFFLISTATFAQTNYEIHTTSTSEKFDSKGELKSRRIFSSGIHGDEIVNVEMILSPTNVLMELTINDEVIMPLMFKEYKILTDYIISYINKEEQPAAAKQVSQTTKIVSDNPANENQLTDDDRRRLMNLIKEQLITDNLIENSDVFDFLITGSALYINGKQQEDTIFVKYKAIYDKYSEVPLTKTTYFQITQTL